MFLLLRRLADVVPIDEHTVELWEHDPFGGYFDGMRVTLQLTICDMFPTIRGGTVGPREH